MSAVQHSHESNEWGTPECVLWRVRGLSSDDRIDFDPCSSEAFNKRVMAASYMSASGNALRGDWPRSNLVLLNPPGNDPTEENMPKLFWEKVVEQRRRNRFGHLVWVGFTVEHLRHCQGEVSLIEFPMCVPKDRLWFVRPDGTPGRSPGHANVLAYIEGDIHRASSFYDLFGSLGACR